MDGLLVSQYSVTSSRMVCKAGAASVHARNFSPIQASRASSEALRARPMVEGPRCVLERVGGAEGFEPGCALDAASVEGAGG